MAAMAQSRTTGPWWREPTKDQWYAFIAAWLGWTLDAFDFTVFLFLLVPIAKEFNADLTLVVFVGSLTMWMRFVGAIAAGWMADKMGRRAPLMISIPGMANAGNILLAEITAAAPDQYMTMLAEEQERQELRNRPNG